MSRIGYKPISIPANVDVKIEGNKVSVKGPKGELSREVDMGFEMSVEDNEFTISRPDDNRKNKALHGLFRSLIQNMVEGVSNGFSKTLLIEGTGYRAQKQGNKLVMNLGFSHQVIMEDPEGITVEVPDDRKIIVSGFDKQLVGNYAANIRKWRKPEPYKGKGIRYENEIIRKKVGKTG